MPESDETRIKEEIQTISKTINSILKKIEQEREKFKPAGIEADQMENPGQTTGNPSDG